MLAPFGAQRNTHGAEVRLQWAAAKRRPLRRPRLRRAEVTMEKVKEKAYSEEEIKQRLAAELPHWYYEDGWIRRKYKTAGWKGTLMVVNTVGHLAEAAWHHPDLTVSYAFVIVKLVTHTAKGVTDKDFALAKKIEDVIMWQPGKEGGPLEGTPNEDQRFKYIKYD
jgi:4a-hydroxytetrahydrobiopterin dehydratase